MNYLTITKYIYLAVGILMAYSAVVTWNDGTDKPWLNVILSGLGFFTFFFRNRFAKKFQNRDSNSQKNKTV